MTVYNTSSTPPPQMPYFIPLTHGDTNHYVRSWNSRIRHITDPFNYRDMHEGSHLRISLEEMQERLSTMYRIGVLRHETFKGYIRLARMHGSDEDVTLGWLVMNQMKFPIDGDIKYELLLHYTNQYSPLRSDIQDKVRSVVTSILTDPFPCLELLTTARNCCLYILSNNQQQGVSARMLPPASDNGYMVQRGYAGELERWETGPEPVSNLQLIDFIHQLKQISNQSLSLVQINQMEEVLRNIRLLGLTPNNYTYTFYLKALLNNGQRHRIAGAIERMKDDGVPPNAFNYLLILSYDLKQNFKDPAFVFSVCEQTKQLEQNAAFVGVLINSLSHVLDASNLDECLRYGRDLFSFTMTNRKRQHWINWILLFLKIKNIECTLQLIQEMTEKKARLILTEITKVIDVLSVANDTPDVVYHAIRKKLSSDLEYHKLQRPDDSSLAAFIDRLSM